MDKLTSKKFTRLLRYDLKNGFGDKILLFIELMLCILLLSSALSGLFRGHYIESVYEDVLNYHQIVFYPKHINADDYNEDEYNKQLATVKQIREENLIGFIGGVSYITEPPTFVDERRFITFDNTMVEKSPLDVVKGRQLSPNNGGLTQIVLNYDYIGDYELGDIVEPAELNIIDYKDELGMIEIVGFLDKNAMVYVATGGVRYTAGVLSVPSKVGDSFFYGHIIINNISATDFTNTYELSDLSVNQYRLTSIRDDYDANYKSTHESMMSMINMFTILVILLLISSLMAITVVKYNNSMIRNTLMVKMGSTKQQMLAVKLFNMVFILLLASIVAGVLTLLVPIVLGKIMDYFVIKFVYIVYSILIVGGMYSIAEGAQVVALYKSIKKEKS